MNLIFKVNVNATGNGMALFQLITNYNIPKVADTPIFKLSQRSLESNFNVLKIQTCVTYDKTSTPNKANSTGMALIESTLLSGYTANKQDLDNLVKSKSVDSLKLVEIKDESQVVFYLDQLDDKSEVCINWKMEKQTQVDDLKAAPVKVSDYYQSYLEYSILFDPPSE